jgi:phosphoglycolate phosphatase
LKVLKKVPIEALFYDLDGTLVDSRRDLCIATNVMLTHFGLPPKSEQELTHYIGLGAENLIRSALRGYDSLYEEGFEVMRSYYRRHLTDHTTLYEGVLEALDYYKGKKQFVLTNKLENESEMILEQLGIGHYFASVSGDTGSAPMKPDPWRLTELLLQYHLSPKESVMVGDSEIDIETGCKAQVMTVFFKGWIGQKGSLQPDFTINNIKDLQNHFI